MAIPLNVWVGNRFAIKKFKWRAKTKKNLQKIGKLIFLVTFALDETICRHISIGIVVVQFLWVSPALCL
jgi:hypothetical protein